MQRTRAHARIATALLVFGACTGAAEDGSSDGTSTGESGTGAPTSGPDSGGPIDTGTADGVDSDSGSPTSADSSTGIDTGADTEPGTDTGPNPETPHFSDVAFEDYVQQDRMGFPGIATAMIPASERDAYNASNPVEDAATTWAGSIAASLNFLHIAGNSLSLPFPGAGLANDLVADGYEPCTPPAALMDNCFGQGLHVAAFPDVLIIDLDSSFDADDLYLRVSAGRTLELDVMDVLLAMLLLDLEVESGEAFWDLDGNGAPGDSLNPFTNDVEFLGGWPYLADAN